MIGIKGNKNYVYKPQKGRSGELMSVGASKPLYIRSEAPKLIPTDVHLVRWSPSGYK